MDHAHYSATSVSGIKRIRRRVRQREERRSLVRGEESDGLLKGGAGLRSQDHRDTWHQGTPSGFRDRKLSVPLAPASLSPFLSDSNPFVDEIDVESQTPILSLASTQSTLLSHEVYLTDRIDNPSRSLPTSSSSAASTSAYPPSSSRPVERLPHLKCICLLRPTEESIVACEREIREGRYGSYWLCKSRPFSLILEHLRLLIALATAPPQTSPMSCQSLRSRDWPRQMSTSSFARYR